MNIEKTLPKAWEEIAKKESSISKKSGFNLDKSDAINSNSTTTLATSVAVKTAYDKGVEALTNSNTKLAKGNLPAKITNAEDMYKLLENKSGLEFDPNLLYLNDIGTKIAGKAYFDRNKKGIFKCTQTTSSITNSTNYFVDFSNNANSDRLANLIDINNKSTANFCITLNNLIIQGGIIELPNTIMSGNVSTFKLIKELKSFGYIYISPKNLSLSQYESTYSQVFSCEIPNFPANVFKVSHANQKHPISLCWIAIGE